MDSSKTIETVMRRLNLEDFESYANRITMKQKMDPIFQRMFQNQVGRATGQTTKMLVEALAYLVDTEFDIMLVAHNKQYALDLKSQLGRMAAQCGFINLRKERVHIGFFDKYMEGSYKKYEADGAVFVDHHAWATQYDKLMPPKQHTRT